MQETKQFWKGNIAILMLLAAFLGLLCARSVASVAMFLFGVNALWGVPPKRWLRQGWWLLGLAWVGLFALSFFWTDNTSEWGSHLQVKLPFLLLPLAFAFLPKFSKKQTDFFTWALGGMMFVAAVYGLWPLTHSSARLIDSYKYAHVLRTAMFNDHISFSAAVACTIAWMFYYLQFLEKKWSKFLLLLLALFLAVYLHILAAKTGLVAFYILLFGLAVAQFRKSIKKGFLILMLIVVGFGAAYTFIPTLRERIGYSQVTWAYYARGERSGNFSDAGRLISYKLSLKSIAVHPLLGVGAGDVLDEMKTGYRRHYPDVKEEQMLWPHNQYLITAMAIGIPGALLLIAWIFWPLRFVRRNRASLYFLLMVAMLQVFLMVDPVFEVQAGVGVFLLFFLWQKKAMIDDSAIDESL